MDEVLKWLAGDPGVRNFAIKVEADRVRLGMTGKVGSQHMLKNREMIIGRAPNGRTDSEWRDISIEFLKLITATLDEFRNPSTPNSASPSIQTFENFKP